MTRGQHEALVTLNHVDRVLDELTVAVLALGPSLRLDLKLARLNLASASLRREIARLPGKENDNAQIPARITAPETQA